MRNKLHNFNSQPRASGWRWLSVLLLATGSAVSACTTTTTGQGDGSQQSQTSPDGDVKPSAAMVSYWQQQGPTLRQFAQQADRLAQANPNTPTGDCSQLAKNFDQLGQPDALSHAAAGAPDAVYQQALTEQIYAVSSAFAACRGAAPISFAESLQELRVSNEALKSLLAKGGLQ